MKNIIRNTLALATGLGLSLISPAVGGMVLYRLSDRFTESQLGAIARFAGDPAIALIVGLIVGLLAKSHPKILAALSLLPILLRQTSSRSHYFVFLFMELICILLGIGAATSVFKRRSRSKITAESKG